MNRFSTATQTQVEYIHRPAPEPRIPERGAWSSTPRFAAVDRSRQRISEEHQEIIDLFLLLTQSPHLSSEEILLLQRDQERLLSLSLDTLEEREELVQILNRALFETTSFETTSERESYQEKILSLLEKFTDRHPDVLSIRITHLLVQAEREPRFNSRQNLIREYAQILQNFSQVNEKERKKASKALAHLLYNVICPRRSHSEYLESDRHDPYEEEVLLLLQRTLPAEENEMDAVDNFLLQCEELGAKHKAKKRAQKKEREELTAMVREAVQEAFEETSEALLRNTQPFIQIISAEQRETETHLAELNEQRRLQAAFFGSQVQSIEERIEGVGNNISCNFTRAEQLDARAGEEQKTLCKTINKAKSIIGKLL